MNNLDPDTRAELTKLALKASMPFCYGCYIKAPSGRCVKCHSDDLMRIMPDDGPEYGTEWIIQRLIRANLDKIDVDEDFEEMLRDIYPDDVQIGFIKWDPVDAMKELDSCAFYLAKIEHIDNRVTDGEWFECGDDYFSVYDLEKWLESADIGPAKHLEIVINNAG